MNLSLEQRIAGILVPVFALRGRKDLGIGDTAALIEFIDWAADLGFRVGKILPINETGGDHSPYNAISSRALEPTTIHTAPGTLTDLHEAEYEEALRRIDTAKLNLDTVDYAVVKPLKRRLLEKAFLRFDHGPLRRDTKRGQEFRAFVEAEHEWLEDYAIFRALMERNGGSERWDHWRQGHRSPGEARHWISTLPKQDARSLERRIRFFRYVQWIAFKQWRQVKAHASERGMALMGDIPFGISYYSADVWAHPQLFKADWCGGTPPDKMFTHDRFVQKWGQNWGIPLYDWETMRRDDFRWWRARVRGVREFFDLFRIDHVLGFYRIYGFPWRPEHNAEFLELNEQEVRQRTGDEMPRFQPRPDETAAQKLQNQRDGEEYLRAVLSEAGAGRVVGEDLGEVPDYVRPSLKTLGIAGYKIPAWEKRKDGELIPGYDYERLSLATYGTHDHDTLRVTWEELALAANKPNGEKARQEMRLLWRYAGLESEPSPVFTPEFHQALLRALFRSNSWIAVVMITDLFGRSERFNLPGVAVGNWSGRLHASIAQLSSESVVVTVTELLRESGRASAAMGHAAQPRKDSSPAIEPSYS
ncbi:MAG: 4-alpha-glucanotransferase [Chthoniobacter sp.]|jgi:4-alpha-glucanotransferase|nr:4-alpha-glucanotransferase [Chthoniobacter sp.]